MSGSAWSNDQLNQLLIYAASTGSLILSVDQNGFRYIVTNREYDFNTAGFVLTALPNDGSFGEFTTAPGFGAVLFLQPVNSAAPVVIDPAIIYSGRDDTGVISSRPFLKLDSPFIDPSGHTAQLILHAQSSASTVGDDSIVEFIGSQIYVNGVAVGIGWVNNGQATANFGPIGNTETIFIPSTQKYTYKAGHAYYMSVSGQFTVSAAPNRPLFRVRQSSDGSTDLGTQIYASGPPAVNTSMHDGGFTCKFRVGSAADVQTYIVLTMQSTSAGFTFTALNSPPFQYDIFDIGAGSNHPDAVTIT